MAVSAKDLKILWGLAAGICSRPGCGEQCIKHFGANEPTILGEMAHMIAKQPGGPRGASDEGSDAYSNLILLCPNHHTEVDKAPEGAFPVATLRDWKRRHEARVKESLLTPAYDNLEALASAIQKLLEENRRTWTTYGPESEEAKRNPTSSLARIWEYRKLQSIVPNNRRVINLVLQNKNLFNLEDYGICCEFIEHAEGFESNCYDRTEGVPRFPVGFGEMIYEHV